MVKRLASPNRRGGFTLLEAVVALASALVIAAALLPALSTARQQAQTNACLLNQAALGIGTASYIQAYNELPGIHYQEGTYWGRTWGVPYYYGGVQAWMRNGPNFPDDTLGGTPGRPTGFSGIGYVQPYVGGDGKTFYCPGTKGSFEGSDRRPWYDYWKGTGKSPYPNGPEKDLKFYGFGQQDRAALITYYYRSGMYDIDSTLADNDPRWAPGNPEWNWTRDRLVHPSDSFVQSKPMLTCFWPGRRDDGAPNWNQTNPNLDVIAHGGTKTNLLYTDGSARTWNLPSNLAPVWGWFDAGAYTRAEFSTGSVANGFELGYPHDFYSQMPWFWVEAARGTQP